MKKTIGRLLALCLILALLPAGATAANVMLSPQKLTVNGIRVECEKYNIDGSNYFKLRDIAYLLNGTENQFGVGYDNASHTVTVTSGTAYTPNGSELVIGEDKSATAVPSVQTILINGVEDAGLSAYNLGGNNYFKLRDLGEALGFLVDYDKASNTAIVESRDHAAGKAPASPEEGKTLSAREIYRRCSPAVFQIWTYDVEEELYGIGSGFFIEADGVAVTNCHVLRNALSATAVLENGKEYDISGVLYFDREMDYAIIKVDGSGFEVLELGDSSAVSGGDTVYAIGSPQGLQNTISDGIVSNPPREDFGGLIQITAPISHGSSGGALIDTGGKVIGVTAAGISSGQNLNFAVPIDPVRESWKSLSAEKNGELLSLARFAELNEYQTYESRPDPYDWIIPECEPNDSFSEAVEIENGSTVEGSLTDEKADVFLVRCNTVGLIHAYLYSYSSEKYLKDMVFAAAPTDVLLSEVVYADYVRLGEEGGFPCLELIYVIPKPGIYAIAVFSDSLAQTEKLANEYDLYCEFIPGMTDAENSAGDYLLPEAIPSDARQREAFDALKRWILENYNDTIGSSEDAGYFEDNTYDNGDRETMGAIYSDESECIILYSYYEYAGGATDTAGVYIYPSEFMCSAVYHFYDETDELAFNGSAILEASAFSGSRKIDFINRSSEFSDDDDLNIMESNARLAFCCCLQFADDLLRYAVLPLRTYSIADFGFDPDALSVPD